MQGSVPLTLALFKIQLYSFASTTYRDVRNRGIPHDLFMKREEERPLDLIKALYNSYIIAIII